MKKLLALSLVFGLSACGGSQQPPAPAPPPVPPPVSTAPVEPAPATEPAASQATAVQDWSDLETLEKAMEENGDDMKKLRAAAKNGDAKAALEPASSLAKSFEELAAHAKGFKGETPEKFQKFADETLAAAKDLNTLLAAAEVPAAELQKKVETFRGTCKNCHDLYRKKD